MYIYNFEKINYVQNLQNKLYTKNKLCTENENFKVQRIGFREYDTKDAPWTSDDFVEEELEKLTIYW
jgi:hypothetical protein